MGGKTGSKVSFIIMIVLVILSVTCILLLIDSRHKYFGEGDGGVGSSSPSPFVSATAEATSTPTPPEADITAVPGTSTPDINPTVTPSLQPTAEPTPTPEISHLPQGFAYISDYIDNLQLDIRYYTDNNFTGARVDGYNAPTAILTVEACQALAIAANSFERFGYGIIIYDGYRPQRAVDRFVAWSQDLDDPGRKEYYPNITKEQILSWGYFTSPSKHSSGSTVDLGLYYLDTGLPVDMGGGFDLFDEISHHDAPGLTADQARAREILKFIMDNSGFDHVNGEWWHYTLRNEPFPGQYFDFTVE